MGSQGSLKTQTPYNIEDYIGHDSPGFFKILKLDPSFLSEPASQMESLDSYKAAKVVVKALKVLNDAAESGVKMCTDFNAFAMYSKQSC